MPNWPFNLDDWSESLLQSLVADQIPESRTVEYKSGFKPKISGTSDAAAGIDGDELSINVVQFANTVGGFLLIGIKESKGIPQRIEGIECSNLDRLKQHIDVALRKIEPRFSAYRVHGIPVQGGRVVIAIRVEKSWNAPHRVNEKFYYRTNSGHDVMSMDQLRDSIILNAGYQTKLQEFRKERCRKIIENSRFILKEGMIVVLHALPLVANSGSTLVDVVNGRRDLFGDGMPGFGEAGHVSINIDGCSWTSDLGTRAVDAYWQWFRSGCSEMVWVSSLPVPIDGDPAGTPVYDEFEYGDYFVEGVSRVTKAYQLYSIPAPCLIGVTLMRTAGWVINQHRDYRSIPHRAAIPVKDTSLTIDEVVIEDLAVDALGLLKPVLDQIANGFGILRSANY